MYQNGIKPKGCQVHRFLQETLSVCDALAESLFGVCWHNGGWHIMSRSHQNLSACCAVRAVCNISFGSHRIFANFTENGLSSDIF